MKKPTIWYVIADGARARIVHRHEIASGYELDLELESDEAHLPSRALSTDRPGRASESASPARHALEPRQDPHEAAKRAFMHEAAAAVERFDGRFDRLVPVAPARILPELRAALPARLREKAGDELRKDLTRTPIGELGGASAQSGTTPGLTIAASMRAR